MKYKVIISQKAISDHDGARYHYKKIDTQSEQRFKADVQKIIARIQDDPQLYKQIETDQRRAVLDSSFLYDLHYIIDSKLKTVTIIGIFHGRTHPEKVKEQIRLEKTQSVKQEKDRRFKERINQLEKLRKKQGLEKDIGLERNRSIGK